tara:strand:+ start:583 stop:966 length:384 start_codon:yes stop_codon:yes gene_type:complete
MEWYLKVINSYFDFSGRSRRMEYWMFVLINSIISVFCILLDSMLGTVWSIGYGPIYIGYGLAVFIPGLAVAIRRLHDIGKSGWYYLLFIIPIIGPIWLIILFVTEGEQGENKYGPNPKNDNFENRDF